MRDYLTQSNLYRAAALSAVVTSMSIGRILQGSGLLRISLTQAFVACFLAMMMVSGAVTAWGRCGGMPGIVTDRKTFLRGTALALVALLVTLPLYRYLLDPFYFRLCSAAGKSEILEMTFPTSLAGQLALMGWMAGFQNLLYCSAPMSLLARLTGRRNVALLLTLALDGYLIFLKVAEHGMREHFWAFAVPGLLSSGLACFMFSRFGLVPTTLLAGGMTLRFFLPPVG